jgi:hypothetical protein
MATAIPMAAETVRGSSTGGQRRPGGGGVGQAGDGVDGRGDQPVADPAGAGDGHAQAEPGE